MAVTEEMGRIEATIEETFDRHQRTEARKTAKSRLNVYRKALKEVSNVAGTAAMHELGEWIRERIEDRKKAPSGRQVRQHGARICREHGHEISTGSWLGA